MNLVEVEALIQKMLVDCQFYPRGAEVTFVEPYIPFVPPNWNGVLVLAEAQNHGVKSRSYVDWLKALSPEQRLMRLYLWKSEERGIQPWDDCFLKVAVAALGYDPAETAVSNAVPWSRVSGTGTNENPSESGEAEAAAFLSRLLKTLSPRLILASGAVAARVLELAERGRPPSKIIALKSPSAQNINRSVGFFAEDDLLARYPEVCKLKERRPEWFAKSRATKVFFACHAISMGSVARAETPA